ncbi:MAG: 3-deoxy-manno-octulosonate cytidylyltransferase [Bacteroidetes bacterium MED-G17]|nr:MAG: 3-deoxy-D-manno-octulosonate cytidylyltransferase [Bacteroidetes bacterium TMED39]PDH52340.1 MAG: 3-deoxy-manno-octulosonate cytidylyltransferase [Bacteroidetes bacterium MED-G17]|tara:strand:- start:10918 stop:11706 length:789 start_codon:yes stop_codon:yes gene_type:complete
MNSLIVIPARYNSQRFPGKPLADIVGKTMIQHVYEKAAASKASRVIVATDDERIFNTVVKFGGEVIMTSPDHNNGTERCAEVLEHLENEGKGFDILVNLQGDEPLINPKEIDKIIDFFKQNETTEILTLVKEISNLEELESPNVVKVVSTIFHENTADALYFSRQVIPYLRNMGKEQWLSNHIFYKHIGIYAFQAEIVPELVDVPEAPLENAESLEQLRWLQDHFVISLLKTQMESNGVDSPEDLERIKQLLSNHPQQQKIP